MIFFIIHILFYFRYIIFHNRFEVFSQSQNKYYEIIFLLLFYSQTVQYLKWCVSFAPYYIFILYYKVNIVSKKKIH